MTILTKIKINDKNVKRIFFKSLHDDSTFRKCDKKKQYAIKQFQ